SLPAMEHLALGLVWLLGMVASVSPMFPQVHLTQMDMAPYSFDDQYQGCSHIMEAKLNKLNHKEFQINSIYAVAWNTAKAKWQSTPQSSVLKPAQAIALMAYTLNNPPLYKYFNAAVRQAGRSRKEYLYNFHYKALHFLLTQAVRNLRHAQQNRCYHVYRGVANIIFTAQHGQYVRFGQFTSTSLDKTIAEKFGKGGTVFSVKTCHGVPIRKFSFYPSEEEVLIPPFETFKVIRVTQKWNRAHIELQTQGVRSNYNCEYVKGKVLGDG
ncbi:NARE ribosyltransferase, partial [Atlantisia rogersi]|nr:NARE ribosyltransferase [Atlantisia rogersi]